MKKIFFIAIMILISNLVSSQIIVKNTKTLSFLDSLMNMTKIEKAKYLKMQNYKYSYDEKLDFETYKNMDSKSDMFVINDTMVTTWMSASEFNSFRSSFQNENYELYDMIKGFEYYKNDTYILTVFFCEELGVYVIVMYLKN